MSLNLNGYEYPSADKISAGGKIMDEVEHVAYLERLYMEAYQLAVRLKVESIEGVHPEDSHDVEKGYIRKARAIRRFRRRWNKWAAAHIEMLKTDEQKAREAEHERLAQMFMREHGMSKIDAYAAASGALAMRDIEDEDRHGPKDEPIN